jgi:hypothetical protein
MWMKHCTMKCFMTCSPHQILSGWDKWRRMRCVGHIVFCWGNRKERDHLEDLGVDERIILKRILET